MAHENTLRLVGLALRAGRLEAGEDAAAEACQYRRARLVLLAADAAEGTASRALRAAGADHRMKLIHEQNHIGI